MKPASTGVCGRCSSADRTTTNPAVGLIAAKFGPAARLTAGPNFHGFRGLGAVRTVLKLVVASPVLGIAGCEAPTDRLDPDVVAELSVEGGDASGVERSGLYALQLREESCGCMLGGVLQALTLCGSVLAPAIDGTVAAEAVVTASDGHLVVELLEVPNMTTVGPLYEDGDFEGGAVTHLTSFATEGSLVSRVEGTLAAGEDGRIDIEGTLERRLVGRTELDLASADDIDCRDSLSFTGTRTSIR